MKQQLPKQLFASIIIIMLLMISKTGMAQEIVKPSGVFQIQKAEPEKIKKLLQHLSITKEFEDEGIRMAPWSFRIRCIIFVQV